MRNPLDVRRLKRLRTEKGLSQTALARKAGMTKQMLNAVESGRSHFSPASLARIADALGCEIKELLPEEPPPAPADGHPASAA
jgi:transcriptional regulator with XRE-family HTH domain